MRQHGGLGKAGGAGGVLDVDGVVGPQGFLGGGQFRRVDGTALIEHLVVGDGTGGRFS